MKIQIIKDESESIEGISNIVIKDDKVEELSSVVSNSCTLVLLDKSLDYLSYDSAVSCLAECLSKVRLGGEIIINGFCINNSHSMYASNQVDVHTLNMSIFAIKSFQNHENIIYTLEKHGFVVESVLKHGMYYEIKAQRVS